MSLREEERESRDLRALGRCEGGMYLPEGVVAPEAGMDSEKRELVRS